jgi:hypothetical protein
MKNFHSNTLYIQVSIRNMIINLIEKYREEMKDKDSDNIFYGNEWYFYDNPITFSC